MKEKKVKPKKTFGKSLINMMLPQNMVVSLISVFYIFYFTELPYASFGTDGCIRLAIIVLATVILLQIILAPFITHISTGKITASILKDESDGLQPLERTYLLRNVMRLPLKISMEIGVLFLFSAILLMFVVYNFFNVDAFTMEFFLSCGVFCSYIALLAAFSYTETVCSKYAIALIEKGVDFDTVRKDKFYGPSLIKRMILFVSIVAVLANAIIVFLIIKTLRTNYQGNNVFGFLQVQATKINLMILINLITSIIYSYIAFWQLSNSYKAINGVLETLLANIEQKGLSLGTDLSNDFSYSYFLINGIITYFHTLVDDVVKTGQNILFATENLFVTAQEASVTASEENDNVKRCLFSVDALTEILAQISESLYRVSSISAEAKIDIDEGYEILHTEIIEKKINEITNANIKTILDIKSFSEKIDNVWNIIKDIDKITEKTKIIAFNAELGATESGENGESFHIIASEIRRLALTITESSLKIKDYIRSIQEFSDSLIVTSEVGTQKIREGSKFFSELEGDFADLRTAIDISAESAISIQQIANTQDSVFTQIKTAFDQISTGFNQFAETAQYINTVAEELRDISSQIKTIDSNVPVSQGEQQ